MTPDGEDRPSPPSIPPAPPSAEMLAPRASHVPLTPMMDFLQRRLETLERELAAERERARSAQGMLTQQESMRGEVESNLKGLYDQIRKEKSDRESEEMKAHARGRVDALEKRLDEMHQTWANLLKEAITNRDSTEVRESSTTLKSVTNLNQQIEQWRADVSAIPAEERRVLAQLSERLDHFTSEIDARIGQAERRQTLESEKQDARLAEFGRERAAIQEALAEQSHAVRQEFVKERLRRENELNELIKGSLAGGAAEVKGELAKLVDQLNTPPKVKDQLVADLEQEKLDLMRALKDRSETLTKFMAERRAVEQTMGQSMLETHGRLDGEREKTRQTERVAAQLEERIKTLEDRLEAAARGAADKDVRWAVLAAERDELTKALLAEAAKVREQIAERVRSEAAWGAKLSQAQDRTAAETARAAKEAVSVSEARSQLTVVSDQMMRALQDRDAILNRFAAWEKDRQTLFKTIRDKDEMIAMLSSSFQNILKK